MILCVFLLSIFFTMISPSLKEPLQCACTLPRGGTIAQRCAHRCPVWTPETEYTSSTYSWADLGKSNYLHDHHIPICKMGLTILILHSIVMKIKCFNSHKALSRVPHSSTNYWSKALAVFSVITLCKFNIVTMFCGLQLKENVMNLI